MVKVVIDREMRDAFRKKARLDRFREGGRIRLVKSIQHTGRAAWYWEEIFSWGQYSSTATQTSTNTTMNLQSG